MSSTPTIFENIQALREQLKPLRSSQRIALVPTMGNLHEGHLSLVEQAKEQADVVVVSIFVNPTQFGIGEDFDSYPRTLEADVEKLASVGVDFVFAPSLEEMYPNYPNPLTTEMHLGDLTMHLCGKSRPGHFNGVGLIVSKLFNIVQPDVAVFGKKDYQQLALIKQIVADLSYPVEIIKAEIVRASDGLALSSRNRYITEKEREKANFNVDYLNVRTQQLTDPTPEDKELVILVAAWLGKARLLDNQEVTVRTD